MKHMYSLWTLAYTAWDQTKKKETLPIVQVPQNNLWWQKYVFKAVQPFKSPSYRRQWSRVIGLMGLEEEGEINSFVERFLVTSS